MVGSSSSLGSGITRQLGGQSCEQEVEQRQRHQRLGDSKSAHEMRFKAIKRYALVGESYGREPRGGVRALQGIRTCGVGTCAV